MRDPSSLGCFRCTVLDLEDASFGWPLTAVHSAPGSCLSTLCWGHFSSFQMVLLCWELLKATYWHLSSTESSLAHGKPDLCPTNPWKCCPTLTLCSATRQAAPASFWLQTFFPGVSQSPSMWLSLQTISLSEDPLEVPLTQFRMSVRCLLPL